jgi:hypothetical protein
MGDRNNSDDMKEYLIVTAHPALPDRVKAQGLSVGEAWKRTALRNKLIALAIKIQKQVVDRHGGEIICDGSNYGLHGSTSNDMIRVKTTEAGFAALRKIPDIGHISESIDFNKLETQPDGVSNIPPGVCWTRPEKKR